MTQQELKELRLWQDNAEPLNLDNPILLAWHRKAIAKRCYFDKSCNRIKCDVSTYENREYFAGGYLIFDMNSLAIWSVKNLLEVARFVESR